GEKNYVLYSKLEKHRDEVTVYFQEVSQDVVLMGSPLRVTTFKGAKLKDPNSFWGAFNTIQSTAIYVAFPENKNHIVLVRANDSQLDIRAFSLDKGELWSKVIQLNDVRKEIYRLREIQVSEN